MITIIAEKASVGRAIAEVVGARDRRNGYIAGGSLHGEPCRVSWARGHLVEIYSPAENVQWSSSVLPILPESYSLRPISSGKDRDGNVIPDKDCVAQLKVLEELISKSDTVVNAGDAGREGELIQRLIYRYVAEKNPSCRGKVFKRLWISSLTNEAIRDGLDHLVPGSDYDNLFAAGMARAEADRLLGINGTIALTVTARTGGAKTGVLSVGRVQTPTLALVCRRYLENKNFVPAPFWVIRAGTESGGLAFTADSVKRYDNRNEAQTDIGRVRSCGSLTVDDVEVKPVTKRPPLLHDLTSLQQEANTRHGLTAAQVLETLEQLYLAKLVTYPRTGSKYITDDVYKTIPRLIERLSGETDYGAYARSMQGHKPYYGCVNAEKVTDHHALLTTGVKAEGLTDVQRKIYDLVAIRMLEAFSDPCKCESTKISLSSDGVPFSVGGTRILVPGWKAVRNEKDVEKDSNGDVVQEQTLPVLTKGQVLPVVTAELKEGKTKPKPLLTDATLLAAMEKAGKDSDDEEIKDAMKDVGIGTPATRAAIIETLGKRKYTEYKGKSIVPTAVGLAVYDIVKPMSVADVETTGKWELALALIAEGKNNPDDFGQGIRRYTASVTNELLGSTSLAGAVQSATDADTVKCPVCGKPMRLSEKGIWCTNRDSCGLFVGRQAFGKTLTGNQLRSLCLKGATGLIKGFKGKSGKEFDAKLKLKVTKSGDRLYGNFDLEFQDNKNKKR